MTAQTREDGTRSAVRGFHDCYKRPGGGSYDLWADDRGIVSCGGCGARDLLPKKEAIAEAQGAVDRLADRVRTDILADMRTRSGRAGFRKRLQ